ncbi:MAG TPA: TlpA disulfide reductase family protein, partial [Chloroflexota bacterium]
NILGGVATLLIVAAVFGYAIFRSYSTASGTSAALTDPNALNPVTNMQSVGSQATNFTLRDASGKAYTLAAQRGHPVLLEYFAVWCPICRGEAPIMAQVTKNYVPKGVRVWSILASPYGRNYEASGGTDLSLATKSDLSWFAQTYNVQHPQLIDPNFSVVNAYGINAYPGLYVIASNGKITYASSGHESYTTLAKQLNKALTTSAR